MKGTQKLQGVQYLPPLLAPSHFPQETFNDLTSSGSIPLLNWATGIEVTAAFVLLFNEFLEEVVVARRERP